MSRWIATRAQRSSGAHDTHSGGDRAGGALCRVGPAVCCRRDAMMPAVMSWATTPVTPSGGSRAGHERVDRQR
jgi:hypothetical protein